MKIRIGLLAAVCFLAVTQGRAERPVGITVFKQPGFHSGLAGVAPYSTRPALRAGKVVTFLGKYDARTNDVYLLDPPWLHLRWPRQRHWRIYFLDETDLSHKQVISEYLMPDAAKRIEQLPVVDEFVTAMLSQDLPRPKNPMLTLNVIFGEQLPLAMKHLDPLTTVGTLFCDNLGNDSPNLQQVFSMRVPPGGGRLIHTELGIFTARITSSRPELSFHQKEKLALPHFILKSRRVQPIQTSWTDAQLDRKFKQILELQLEEIEAICRRNQLSVSLAEPLRIHPSWQDSHVVRSALITARPQYSRTPVPFASFSVFFDLQTGEAGKRMISLSLHQDPLD